MTDKVHKIIKHHAKFKIITNTEVELETNQGNGNGGNKAVENKDREIILGAGSWNP